MKWLSSLFLLIIFFLLFKSPIWAVSEFVESHKTIYQIDESGMATVLESIELKNKVSNVYADKYWLSVGFTNLENVVVNDGSGEVKPEIKHTQNQTTINFAFVNKVVLKDKANRFDISYKTPDIVTKNGSVWEINIPKLDVQNDLGDYEVTLIVPSSFGQPAFITPEPISKTTNSPSPGVNNSYYFRMDLSGNRSISAVFGTSQYMNFDLSFYLENINPVKTEMEIALPPDTNYQQIWLQEIDPKPVTIKRDVDGNWLAKYLVPGNQNLKIKVKGVAKINFLPRPTIENEEILKSYLNATDLWNTNAFKISDLGKSLKTPQAIYQYVVDHLSYDYGKINAANGRLGAESVLEQPASSICTDYSDLFVALSRASGTPARELEGYAFTSNDSLRPVSLKKDILHSWPEYYDLTKQTWVYTDPTWEDTTGGVDYFNKIDLNHLVFVIHGQKSYAPLPAGAYRDPRKSGKDVEVSATDPVKMPEPKIEMTVNKGVLGIKNNGEVGSEAKLTIASEPAGIIDYKSNISVPPMGEQNIELAKLANIKTNNKIKVNINYGNSKISTETTLKNDPIGTIGLAGLGGMGIFLVIAGYYTGGLWVRGRKKKADLYW